MTKIWNCTLGFDKKKLLLSNFISPRWDWAQIFKSIWRLNTWIEKISYIIFLLYLFKAKPFSREWSHLDTIWKSFDLPFGKNLSWSNYVPKLIISIAINCNPMSIQLDRWKIWRNTKIADFFQSPQTDAIKLFQENSK